MPTLTRPRRPVKPATFRLTLHIGDAPYAVRPLAVEPGSGIARLVRLRKDGTAYHVHRDEDGRAGCDCADFEFRHAGNGTACKHIRPLAACGLI